MYHPPIDSLEPRRLFAGTGLTAQYYDNPDFTSLKLTALSPQLNYNWGTASPTPAVAPDTFSVRWTGAVQPQYSELYTFHVTGDDGYRLWVNDQLIVNNYLTTASPTEASGQIALRAGQRYTLRLEYFDNTGPAQLSLAWSSPSTPKQLVPTARLYPAATPDDRGSALAETWTDIGGNSALSLRTNANFMAGKLPAYRNTLPTLESLAQNTGQSLGTKVHGYLVPDTTGPYRFAVSGSTDVQLYLSTTPDTSTFSSTTRIASLSSPTPFRSFTGQPSQQSATLTLTAGERYYFELWHKAGQTTDHFSVAWQTPWQTPWAPAAWTVVDGAFLVPFAVDTPAPPIPTGTAPFTDLFTNLKPARRAVLATPDEWAKALALAATSPLHTTVKNNILAAANAKLADAPVTYIAASSQAILQDLEADLTTLAAAWKLTANDAYAAKAWEKMSQALAFPTWDGGNQALGIGMGAVGIANAYDWLNPWLQANLTPAQLQSIPDAVNRLMIAPVTATLKAGNYWANWDNNWAFVVAGGTLTAAFAIAPLYTQQTSELIARAVPEFKSVIDRTMGTNAGGSEEGTGYNTYGGTYLVKALAALSHTFGHDFGVSRADGFSQYANFMFAQYANNNANAMVMFSEGQWTQIFEPWNFYFATRFARTDAAWFIRQKMQTGTTDPLALLWWDDRGVAPATAALRTDFASVGDESTYKSEQVHTTRQTWADDNWDAPLLSFKGGNQDNRHDLLDAGTWNYDSQGKRWFPVIYHSDYGLPGYGNTSPTTRPYRWDYYANRAESHNTLVLNGSPAFDQKPGSFSDVTRFLSSPAETVALVDLTAAYSHTPTSKVTRGFRFDKLTGMATIQDEITPAPGQTLSTLDWYANYNQNDGPAPVISNGGKDVMFSQGSARLYMRILSPAGTFDIQDARSLWTGTGAEYLNPPDGMNYAASYDRLHIRLTNLSAPTTLTVVLWGNWGTATPPFPTSTTPVATWFPRDPVQLWAGDIDAARPGDPADSPPLDPVWASQIQVTTSKPLAPLDASTPNRVTPLSFTLPLSPGQTLSSAKLTLSLKSLSTNSNTDTLYLNTPTGTLAYPLNSTALAWSPVTSDPTVRELNLASLKYPNNTPLLTALSAGKLNLALSGNLQLDWANLLYEPTPPTPTTLSRPPSASQTLTTLSPTTFSTTPLPTRTTFSTPLLTPSLPATLPPALTPTPFSATQALLTPDPDLPPTPLDTRLALTPA